MERWPSGEGWTNLYRLKVGDEFELGNSRQVQLRVAGDQLVQSGVQGLLEHQHLAVARVLHQPLHKVSHLCVTRWSTPATLLYKANLKDLVHSLLSLLTVDGEGDLLVGVGLLQLPRNLGLSLLQHRHVERERLVDFAQRFFVLTRQPGGGT